MKRDQIAAQLYTLRDFCRDEADLRESLRRVKEIGYAAVQVSGIGPIATEAVKAAADEHGLAICATHVGFDALEERLQETIDKHKQWGCRYVGLGAMPERYRGSAEGYSAFAAAVSEIGKALQGQDLQFVYHNHRFEYERFEGRTGMDILREQSDAKAVGFELDTYWALAGGVNPADAVRQLKDRMSVVHLKDMAIVDDQQIFAEIGEGNMDFPGIIEACREIGVEWYVVEQDVCRRDPFESLAISYRYLLERAI